MSLVPRYCERCGQPGRHLICPPKQEEAPEIAVIRELAREVTELRKLRDAAYSAIDGRLGLGDDDVGKGRKILWACEAYVQTEDALPGDEFDSEDYQLPRSVAVLVGQRNEARAEAAALREARQDQLVFLPVPATGEDCRCSCVICHKPRDEAGFYDGKPVEWLVRMRVGGATIWQGLHAECWERNREPKAHVPYGPPAFASSDIVSVAEPARGDATLDELRALVREAMPFAQAARSISPHNQELVMPWLEKARSVLGDAPAKCEHPSTIVGRCPDCGEEVGRVR